MALTGRLSGVPGVARARSLLAAPAAREGYAAGGLRFDWAMVGLSSWLVGGAFLDGWAHDHIPQLESFFTPWHGVLYSGFGAVFAFLAVAWAINRRAGYGWRRALPLGYGLALLGCFVFLAGGVGDMLWHQILGIEVGFEALLSPTHLLLGIGAGFIVTGPLRAAWLRPGQAGGTALLPVLVSLALFLSMFSFFTANYHPFGETVAAESWRPAGGVARSLRRVLPTAGYLNILLQTAMLAGLVLLAVRRWRLPFGSLTLVMCLNTALMALMLAGEQQTGVPLMILVGVAAGLAGDLLYRRLRPGPDRVGAVRLFAFALPAVLYALYFAALMATGGVWWSVHVWAGVVVEAAIVGWLMSYLVFPPAAPLAN